MTVTQTAKRPTDPPLEVASALRAELKCLLSRVLVSDGISQSQAARLCATDQPTISKLLSGRSDSVSAEQLLKWMVHLGYDVEISVRRASATGKAAVRTVWHV
jgi:predicted XRE-type DNA-binding protein